MAFPVPVNLSPSRVEAFTSCPLAFRFASIEKLPEPPRPHTTKGSLVHRALELLFADHRPAERTLEAGLAALARATAEYEEELAVIGLEPADEAALRADTVRPSEQSIQFLPRRTAAVWRAVEKACEAADFRPRPGALCDYCAFKPWCPSFGGDPDRAKFEAPVAYAHGPVQLPLVPA